MVRTKSYEALIKRFLTGLDKEHPQRNELILSYARMADNEVRELMERLDDLVLEMKKEPR